MVMGYWFRVTLCTIFSTIIVWIALQYIPPILVRPTPPTKTVNQLPIPSIPTQDKDSRLTRPQPERPPPPKTPTKQKRPTRLASQPDTLYAYQLPYPPNVAHWITQGYMTPPTHHDVHALDIAMPEGTPILATRSGVVTHAVDTTSYSPIMAVRAVKYKDKRNFIQIQHEDNSSAQYGHIQKGSSKVNVGDTINVGQEIAKCGVSNGPHLHFSVYFANTTEWRTFSFLMATQANPRGEILKKGDYPMRPQSTVRYPTNLIDKVEILTLKNETKTIFDQSDQVRIAVRFNFPAEIPVQIFLNRPNARTVEKSVTWSEYKNAVWVDTKAGDLKYHAGKWVVEVKIEDQLLETATFIVTKTLNN